MLDFFSGTIYIHHQKAGSSRNNYCIGLSFELIVRRVCRESIYPAFFFFFAALRAAARLAVVARSVEYSRTLLRLLLAKPAAAAHCLQKRALVRLGPPFTELALRFIYLSLTHPCLREQELHFCRQAKTSPLRQQHFTLPGGASRGLARPPPPYPDLRAAALCGACTLCLFICNTK